jgi:hypothetical protein
VVPVPQPLRDRARTPLAATACSKKQGSVRGRHKLILSKSTVGQI